MSPHRPPFELTPQILALVSQIDRLIGRYEGIHADKPQPKLRRQNRIRTIQGSLAIEGNTLTTAQITAILEGKRVVGPKKDIIEVQNAVAVYDQAPGWTPTQENHFLKAHALLMKGLADEAGRYRKGAVGVISGKKVTHIAPPAKNLPTLMSDLFSFLKKNSDLPALITSAAFHYEIEFIHPFADGNGRMGRLWQHVILANSHPLFEFVPIESIIKKHQKDYYQALKESDQLGQSTPFIEFSLQTILEALSEFIDQLKPEPLTCERRLELAADHFKAQWFSRKQYMSLFKTLSTATASRDLKDGLKRRVMHKKGDVALSRYRFKT